MLKAYVVREGLGTPGLDSPYSISTQNPKPQDWDLSATKIHHQTKASYTKPNLKLDP